MNSAALAFVARATAARVWLSLSHTLALDSDE